MAHIELDRTSGTALTHQLENAIIQNIKSGRLLPGARLPAVRELAKELDLNRNTVQRVYHALTQSGILETRVGDGTYVSEADITADRRGERAIRTKLRQVLESALDAGLKRAEVSALVHFELSEISQNRIQRSVDIIESRIRFSEWGRYGKPPR